MATLYERGLLPLGQDFRHEGILGTVFVGRLVREVTVGQYRAVVPGEQIVSTWDFMYLIEVIDAHGNGRGLRE